MPLKSITAHEAKPGTYILIDGVACVVKSVDISKTGKHGASKARIEAIGIIDDKKRVLVKPGHEKFEVPLIEKRKGQVLSIENENANLMDVENFETFLVFIPNELKETIKEGLQVEYWNVEGQRIIKRVL
ncbi:MAG: translation initiation factor IF-5A [Candidatus Pacearchaeota archaeon]